MITHHTYSIRSRIDLRFSITLLTVCLAVMLALSGTAFSAIIIVTDFNDDKDPDNGTCTLREAIHSANKDIAVDDCFKGNGTDNILLRAGTYTLDLVNGGNENENDAGDLDIKGSIRIQGLGPDVSVIDGVAGLSQERVLHILDLAIVVELQDLTIIGGSEPKNLGGNIYNQSTAPGLLLVNVTVSNGTALTGGGISNSGDMTIRHSTVKGNKANDNLGGGVNNIGTMRIEDTEISNNQAGRGGGIVHLQNALTIFRSIISNNSTTDAVGSGGGILASSPTEIIIEYSTIEGNNALTGGGLFLEDGGASIFNSAILNNTAARQGGGVYDSGNSDIRHSTLSGNSANQGGAVYAASSTQTLLDNNTIAGNTSGGGVFNESGAFFENGVIADNGGGNCVGNKPMAGFFNIDDGNTCEFLDNDPDMPNFNNTDPVLGPLADNGGPSPTYALLPGSPAIDAISSEVRTNCQAAPDQRGYPRGYPPQGDLNVTPVYQCDIGAHEAVAPYVVNSTADAVDNNVKDGICATDSGECTLRAAIQQANAVPGLEEITLPAGTYTLSLAGADEDQSATGDLDIIESVTIQGEGVDASVIEGNGDRVIDMVKPIKMNPRVEQITLRNLTVRNGTADNGGGIRFPVNDLTLDQVRIADNQASIAGAGVYFSGERLWVKDSLVTGNVAAGDGGGIFQSSINDGYVVVERSTLADNQARIGGLYAQRTSLVNSTLSGNTTTGASTLFATRWAVIDSSTITDNEQTDDTMVLFDIAPTIAIRNSILSDNRLRDDMDNCSSSFRFISLGYNLSDSDESECEFDAATDMVDTDPLLGPLADNGGPTPTHALLEDSPAMDFGDDANCPATDQRGESRPADGNGDGAAVCDIGAFEFIRAIVPDGNPGANGGSGGGGGCFIDALQLN